MGAGYPEAIKQLRALVDEDLAEDEALRNTFQNMHQGYPNETLVRFLKAREWNASKARKMLIDCLNWRIENEIDVILTKPIVPAELYRAVRDSQLIGVSGYSRQAAAMAPSTCLLSSHPFLFLCCGLLSDHGVVSSCC